MYARIPKSKFDHDSALFACENLLLRGLGRFAPNSYTQS